MAAGTAIVALSPGWHLGDPYTLGFLFLGVAVLAGVVTMAHESETAVSTSVTYVALGAGAAVVMDAVGIAPLDPREDAPVLEHLTELALVVAVFAAGLTIEREVERRSLATVALLLGVVMPLTILAIAGLAAWTMGLPFAAALLLGAILSPTDPVLAGEVGLGPPGSERVGEPRLSLHTEAGINDGLASPFVALGLFAAERGGAGWAGSWALADLLYGAVVALIAGAAAGWGCAALLTRAEERRIVVRPLDGVAALAAMVLLYGAVEAIGCYGLLAVFAAGFAFRRHEYDHQIHEVAHSSTRAAGSALELLVLLLLGTMLTTAGLGAPGVMGYVLIALLLLVIRPLLVLGVVPGRALDLRGRVFLGLFGVRGVAALFYATVVVASGALRPADERIVVWTTIACVVASVGVHGLLATPMTRWLVRQAPGAAGR